MWSSFIYNSPHHDNIFMKHSILYLFTTNNKKIFFIEKIAPNSCPRQPLISTLFWHKPNRLYLKYKTKNLTKYNIEDIFTLVTHTRWRSISIQEQWAEVVFYCMEHCLILFSPTVPLAFMFRSWNVRNDKNKNKTEN